MSTLIRHRHVLGTLFREVCVEFANLSASVAEQEHLGSEPLEKAASLAQIISRDLLPPVQLTCAV